MCNELLYNKEYVNTQTGEVLDLERISTLPDNAMLKVNPHLWCEWDFEKNNELGYNIWDMTKGSNKRALWRCPVCTHEWGAKINDRSTRKCAVCSNREIKVGFNDMWTTNLELAKLLANPEDGYKYMQSSHVKVDWKCPCCGDIVKNKYIYSIKSRGISCSNCGDGKSYSEKFIYSFLKQSNIIFEDEISFPWSNGKRYDFYVPSLNLIIETHGMQHMDGRGFESIKRRSLTEEQLNDEIKRELALSNGIEYYIELDCRLSEFDYVKNSIYNSQLSNLFDFTVINWVDCHSYTNSSLVKEVSDLWNAGIKSSTRISRELNRNLSSVIKYLKHGALLGLCDFVPNENRSYGAKLGVEKRKVKVICINTGEMFNSISEASKKFNVNLGSISAVCAGKHTHGGTHPVTKEKLKWMYLTDYEKMIEEQNKIS